ncbi:MAG TPA: tetratricopeptide repeat protein [Bordetella sp.]|uniref:tetratricopeptide repeat protein n=1 Tax=Bordetella sp. TaxID=28081 RepID=UPI002ED11464
MPTAMTPMLRFRLAALALPLAATLAICPHIARAQSMGGGGTLVDNSHLTTLDPYPPDQGWQWLAKEMDELRPGVDTRLQPTPTQITDHIEARIDKGDYAGALKLIEWRQAQLQGKPGTDVQLMFQHARVLAALGHIDQAAAIYQDMTRRFPELPEPWNNLATLYVRQGKLNQAGAALRTALQVDPDYADAQANLKQLASRDPGAARAHMTEAPSQ